MAETFLIFFLGVVMFFALFAALYIVRGSTFSFIKFSFGAYVSVLTQVKRLGLAIISYVILNKTSKNC